MLLHISKDYTCELEIKKDVICEMWIYNVSDLQIIIISMTILAVVYLG